MNTKATKFANATDLIAGGIFILLGVFVLWFVANNSTNEVEEQLITARTPYAAKSYLHQVSITPVTVNGQTESYGHYVSELIAIRQNEGDVGRSQEIADALFSTAAAYDTDVQLSAQAFLGELEASTDVLLGPRSGEFAESVSIILPHNQGTTQKQHIVFTVRFDEDHYRGTLNE